MRKGLREHFPVAFRDGEERPPLRDLEVVRAARVAVLEDQMSQPLRVASGKGDARKPAVHEAEQSKRFEVKVVSDRLKVADGRIQREVRGSVGKPASSAVVPDERPPLR